MSEPREGKFDGSQEGKIPKGRYVIPKEVMEWVADYQDRLEKAPTKDKWSKIQDEFRQRTAENSEYELALYRLEHLDWAKYEDMGPHENDLLRRQGYLERRRMEEEAERTPVNPENNFLTHYEETLDRMAKIEGEAWKAQQRKDEPYRAAQARRIIEEGGKGVVVYGEGGWNRWYVQSDGSVEYSAPHELPTSSHLIQAKRLGFKIWGERKKNSGG